MSELVPIPPSEVQVNLKPVLSKEEDDFALAVLEYGGNLEMAYKEVFGDDRLAGQKGRALLQQANVALRVKELSSAIDETILVNTSSHLIELARIRDLAKITGQMKVAYQAERSRGEAIGVYAKHNGGGKGGTAVAVQVLITNKADRDI